MPVMSIGQVAEILTMAVLGGVLARLGWKTTMILGILGHAVRFAVFAFLPQSHFPDHRRAGAPRHLLCVFLRHALHLHRRGLPQRRAK
jgi:hypothetical protein